MASHRQPRHATTPWLCLMILFLCAPFCNSTDTLTVSQPLRDSQTLISAGQVFALGFFSPSNSRSRYLGIWYQGDPDRTVVWVANRENPIINSSSEPLLAIVDGGNLALIDGRRQGVPLWSANVSSTVANHPNAAKAILMDSGNLVLTMTEGGRGRNERMLWQSFDHPTDTFLPGMKIGVDRRVGLSWFLASWRTESEPAPGEYWYGVNLTGIPQFFVMKGSVRIFRSGSWNGVTLTGAMTVSSLFNFQYVGENNNADDDQVVAYFTYSVYNPSLLTRLVLDESGSLRRYMWVEKSRQWNLAYSVPKDECDYYARCGPYGSCDPTTLPESECTCLKGFQPKSDVDWHVGDRSGGCVRQSTLNCTGGGGQDGFLKLSRVKLPDTTNSRVVPGLSLQACEDLCLKNCSCTAYASANISEGNSGCVMWDGPFTDLKVYLDGGQDFYARVNSTTLAISRRSRSLSAMKLAGILSSVLVLLAVLAYGCCRCRKKGQNLRRRHGVSFPDNRIKEGSKSSDLIYFHSDVISSSTNNFSEENMLGKGGFGSVYKGKLSNGQDIAVKKLSENSGQGIEEFKNEVSLIIKLQHRNLVRILGCCISGEEKMLIYEYMQNKSLDCFIFDHTKKAVLDWGKRFSIIMGIARGILYLHEDSRLRIIHRDLKVSNILLDDEMNPRISDFGLARIFGGNQTQEKTCRVIGTYGYMSPEYAMNGLFSVKSDVFSFGVILLEIISGNRNSTYMNCSSLTLIGYAWKLWREDKTLELVDPSINSDSSCQIEVLRCIQVALLCVEERAKDRPNMSSVVFMLGNETPVPSPKQPAFCFQRDEVCKHSHLPMSGSCSKNLITITDVEAR